MSEQDPIDELHERLFGFVPALGGAAYERLTAVVLAVLGWTQVKRASRETQEGRRAKQTLDVVAVHPSGEQRRLIVQCKHLGETVGKEVIDTLVGIGKQLADNPDLAVVTTVGFTSGACDVCVDENVAMILLKRYDANTADTEAGNFIRVVEVTMNFLAPPAISNFGLELGLAEGDVPDRLEGLNTLDKLEAADRTPAESLAQHMVWSELCAGDFDRRVELPESRWLRAGDGRVQIKAITWHERIEQVSHIVRVEGKGEPELVLQQLAEDCKPTSGRLVVDRDLYAWDVDKDNNVVPRGQLGTLLQDRS